MGRLRHRHLVEAPAPLPIWRSSTPAPNVTSYDPSFCGRIRSAPVDDAGGPGAAAAERRELGSHLRTAGTCSSRIVAAIAGSSRKRPRISEPSRGAIAAATRRFRRWSPRTRGSRRSSGHLPVSTMPTLARARRRARAPNERQEDLRAANRMTTVTPPQGKENDAARLRDRWMMIRSSHLGSRSGPTTRQIGEERYSDGRSRPGAGALRERRLRRA